MVASLKFANCRPLALGLSKSYLSCDHPKRENYLLCFPSKLAAARKSENGMKRGKKTCFSHMDTVHFKFIQISSFVLFCRGNMNLALELVTLEALTSFLGSCHQSKPWFHPVPFFISRESPFSRGERNQDASLYIFSSHQPPGLIYCHFL